MARVTREQMEKLNKSMSNGWKLDTWAALVHGDKEATKKIYLNEEKTKYIKASLWFSEKYDRYEPTIEITLHISEWSVDEIGTGHSYGMGLFRRLPYGKNKKMFADICKLTAEISDKYIMGIYNGNENKASDPVILSGAGAHIYNV